MISFTEIRDVPFIGQIVHFFKDNSEKFAAIVTQVHPLEREEGQELIRPKIDAQIFIGERMLFKSEIDPLNIENPEATIKDQWCFVNEFATLQNNDILDEELPGTKSNHHVGCDLGL